jgi:putative hemolysin
MLIEILIILTLLLLNGLFAMTEIAIVSARKSRLRTRAAAGSKGAVAALALAETPNRFLSTVQIGITLIGIVAGAYGGATLSADLSNHLEPFIGAAASEVSFAIVIACLTYGSLVLGELVPKRIAMLRPESISCLMAPLMVRLAKIASPVVSFLGWSTRRVLALFGMLQNAESNVTREDLTVLVKEGVVTGSLRRVESEVLENVLNLEQMDVSDVMTPRPKMVWLNSEAPPELIWHKIVVSNHDCYPVYAGSRDHLLGVVTVKAIYANMAAGLPAEIKDLAVPAAIVPEYQKAAGLAELFKDQAIEMALVVDEYGEMVGLVTPADLLETLIGEHASRIKRKDAAISKLPNDSWLIDGMVPLQDVVETLNPFPMPEGASEHFHTVAGFVLHLLERFPQEGECTTYANWKFEVIEMDGRRIDKILLTKLDPKFKED